MWRVPPACGSPTWRHTCRVLRPTPDINPSPRASVDVRTAVDVVGDAGDVARLLAAEEGDEVSNVVDVAAPADRDLGDELRLTLARKRPASDIGFNKAGRDGIDRHTVRPQLSGQPTGEPQLCGLRRRVRHRTEYAATALS